MIPVQIQVRVFMPGRSLLFRLPLPCVYGVHQQIPVRVVDHAVSVHVSQKEQPRMHASRLIIGKAADDPRGEGQIIRPVLYGKLLRIGCKTRSPDSQYISPRFQVFKRRIALGDAPVFRLLIRSQHHLLRFLPGQGNGKVYILLQIQCGKDLHIDLPQIVPVLASLFFLLVLFVLFFLRAVFLAFLILCAERRVVRIHCEKVLFGWL